MCAVGFENSGREQIKKKFFLCVWVMNYKGYQGYAVYAVYTVEVYEDYEDYEDYEGYEDYESYVWGSCGL